MSGDPRCQLHHPMRVPLLRLGSVSVVSFVGLAALLAAGWVMSEM